MDIEDLKALGLEDEDLASKVSQAVKEHESGLVSKKDELLNLTTKQKQDLEKYQAMEQEYQTIKEKLKEQEKEQMTEQERIEAAKQEAAKEWEEKYSDAEKRLQELTNKERKRERNEAVFRAVGDKGDAELVLDVVAQRGLIEVVDKDDGYGVKVYSLDGKKELESVDKLIEEMKASDRYGRLFNSSGLSGGGSRNSGPQGAPNTDNVFGAQRMRAAREKS